MRHCALKIHFPLHTFMNIIKLIFLLTVNCQRQAILRQLLSFAFLLKYKLILFHLVEKNIISFKITKKRQSK